MKMLPHPALGPLPSTHPTRTPPPQGSLAMKMLGWEDPFAAALRRIRARETHYSRRMARIRALNFALQFCITPIVAFVTFAVYK